jgi:hypothetical protein
MQPRTIINELDSLARKLKNILLRFYNKYVKGSINPFQVKQKYEARIKTELRKVIESSYLRGMNTVGSEIKRKIPDFEIFISVQDVQNIEETTNKMYEQFWTTALKLHKRDSEFIVKDGQLEERIPFEAEAAFVSNSAFVAYAAYNLAVTEKLSEVSINFPLGRNLNYRVKYVRRNPPSVDPLICEPDRNKIFHINDPNRPLLPRHRHCRCLYVPIV